MTTGRKLKREERTIEAMIRIYCTANHEEEKELCSDCSELLDYARARLERCPHQEEKPTCAKCTIHCYRPDMREKVRAVMRYSGPRMILYHPVLAIHHLAHNGRNK